MRLEDLLQKPGPELQAALGRVPDPLLAAALQGAPEAVRSGFLQNLSTRRQEAIDQAGKALGDLGPRGIERSRTLVLKIVLEALGQNIPTVPAAGATTKGPAAVVSKRSIAGFLRRLAMKNAAVAAMQDRRRAQIILDAFLRPTGKPPGEPGKSGGGP